MNSLLKLENTVRREKKEKNLKKKKLLKTKKESIFPPTYERKRYVNTMTRGRLDIQE